jgi:hypothetical protein
MHSLRVRRPRASTLALAALPCLLPSPAGALQVATEKTVSLTGKTDGYFANQAIKILMPEKLRSLESGLRAVGYGGQIDELVLSMNRAAERAAPQAKQIFFDAIGNMTFTPQLTSAFRPVISKSMGEVGVTRQYKDLVARFDAIPFAKSPAFDLDGHVVTRGWPDSSRCRASRRSRSAPTPRPAPPPS